MPGRDQTGPAGAGPLTGCGMGICAENTTRRGFGRGRGFGFRNRFAQPVQPPQPTELSELKEQMARIEKQLKELQASS